MEQLHFHLKFPAEEFLVTFVGTKVTPAAGKNIKNREVYKKLPYQVVAYITPFFLYCFFKKIIH